MADDPNNTEMKASQSPGGSGNGAFDKASGFPDDFPHANRLKKAGISSLAELHEVGSLEDIEGIGPSYAKDIRAALEDLGAGRTQTSEKRPSPISGDGAPEESRQGPWTEQTIDIPDGPIEETTSYNTYPADRFTHDDVGFSDDDVVGLLRSMLLQRRFEERCRQMYQQIGRAHV